MRKLLLTLLLAATPALADIDVQNEYQGASNAMPAVTVGAGSNLGLVCATNHEDEGAETVVATTAITFDDVSMSLAVTHADAKAATETAASIWYLANPSVGEFTPVPTGQSGEDHTYRCYVLTGFAQSDPVANTDMDTETNSGDDTLNLDLTDVDGGFAVGSAIVDGGPGGDWAWTNLTEDYDRHVLGGSIATFASDLISGTSARGVIAANDVGTGEYMTGVAATFSQAAGSSIAPLAAAYYEDAQ